MEERVNVNKASEKELYEIIHVGPVRAKRIIEKRPFRDIYELSTVKGFGRKRIDDIILEGIAYI